jgi:putative tricarboxylic transport membrane protein
MWESALHGLLVALTPGNMLLCFIGALVGTLVGVLPGIGPMGAMAILIPVTFKLDPVGSVIMLAGIYYGAQYGGSLTSILLNIPGEASSVATCIDGHQMARQGRAGAALGISVFSSLVAGVLATIGIILVAQPLATLAIDFGPPEYFALVCVGLALVVFLAQKSIEKAIISGLLGMLISWIGMDNVTGLSRFTFGINELNDGVGIVVVSMGIFGIAEVLINIESKVKRELLSAKLSNLLPTREDWRASFAAMLRGSGVGFLLGILPGGGAIISSFAAYGLEKRLSRHPERFGKGEIAGVAAPEAANNAAAQGGFIPLLSLGIPPNAPIALVFAALIIHGVQPGPLLVRDHPEMFWGVIASMLIGNVWLVLLNLPLIPLWVQVLRIPRGILFPLILIFCIIGSYSLSSSTLDLMWLAVFGVVGYLMRKLEFEPAPFILAFILGPLLENALRQSLVISQGSFAIFVTRPISAICLGVAAALFLSMLVPSVKKKLKNLEGLEVS